MPKCFCFPTTTTRSHRTLEGKLLEEMKDFDVELFSKKRSLINCIKDYKLFSQVASFTDGADSFKFSVLSDQDDGADRHG